MWGSSKSNLLYAENLLPSTLSSPQTLRDAHLLTMESKFETRQSTSSQNYPDNEPRFNPSRL